MMPAPTLDPALLPVVDGYRTCEFATLSRHGVPITWPTCTYRRPDGTFLLTTSIGLPQKAFNIRREPRVAMLFSDPTGSGIDGAPELLVQGTATCPDEIITGTAGTEEYWARLADRQPGSRAYAANAVSRRMFDWYYMRLRITVTPTSFTTRPALPAPAVAPRGSGLAAFPSAVLGVRDPGGAPRLLRVRVGPADRGYPVDVPDDAAVRPGPASLLAHSHDEQLGKLRCLLGVGKLERDSRGWTFAPSRWTPIGGGPLDAIRMLRRVRRTAARYLDRRGLARPTIAWDEFAAIVDP